MSSMETGNGGFFTMPVKAWTDIVFFISFANCGVPEAKAQL
jgi:hypothetical protein